MLQLIFFSLLLISSYVNAYVYKPIYFKEEEVRHVRAAPDAKPLCEEQKLIDILAERQISSPEDIIAIAVNDFEIACHATSATLKRSDELFKNCTAPESLYYSLLYGLRVMDLEMCKNSESYKKFEKFVKCYEDLGKDYENCNGIPDWYENDDEKKICKTYKRIVNCYYIKTAKVCGETAAYYLRQLMKKVIDCALLVKCSVGSPPKVKNAMSDKFVDMSNQGYGFIQSNILMVITFLLHSIISQEAFI